ncbi:FtsQ-type POTRA domain-containing protein [Candidatus Peregrinibacteria bacterium]|nr:FtsQ-type POTRA domain-containing protein [Candidatus Peregrinibacteria bacterium]
MFFKKKSPKRLYYPVKSNWFTRPRLKVRPSRRPLLGNLGGRVSKLVRNFASFAIAGIALAVLTGFLFLSSYFTITGIEVVRQDFSVQSAAIENHLNSFIGKNILFFPQGLAVRAILEQFPEFAAVTVNKELPHTLKITLESHPIVANLKAYYVLPKPAPAETGTALSLITENKEVMDRAFDISGGKNKPATEKTDEIAPVEQKCLINRVGQAIFDKEENLELITITLTGLTQPISDRQQVIPVESMGYLLDSIAYFNNLFSQMKIRSVEYRLAGRELRLKTDTGPVIWITLEKDYKEQLDKLKTIYEPAELDKENLSYIDLRVKEKVIYCPSLAACDKK